MPGPHRPVATIGLHGSASTWVFNVVRELLIAAAGADQVLALYADTTAELPDAAALARRHLVLKSHHGSADLDAWLDAANPIIFLSIRDPRDAAISMAQRFGVGLEHTLNWLGSDCHRMERLAARGHPLLRYEDRFFENQAVPPRLACALGLTLPAEQTDAIFARYATDAVRAFAQSFDRLPPDRLASFGPTTMDRVTQIHRTHIGDTRSGKWRDLPAPLQSTMTRNFAPFLERFGYPA